MGPGQFPPATRPSYALCQGKGRARNPELGSPPVPQCWPWAGARSQHRTQLAMQHGSPQHVCCVVLTKPHARCDGDEGHDATEAAIDGKQRFVEVAGGWVGVELVEEGEGGRGEGVEGGRGQQHSQIPALVLRSSCQPAEEWMSSGRGQVPTRHPGTHQFLFQVCAKAVISTSWMRMKAKPPQTPV